MSAANDPRESRLISVGHYLWRRYKRNRQEPGLMDALETVWQAKRELRAELAVERAAENEKIAQRFKVRKANQRTHMVSNHV